ncbi:hypothetical protein L6R49_03080 [Myxococcota bacterium]|nr:hypothetical protein [Myxococcota bacterium]
MTKTNDAESLQRVQRACADAQTPLAALLSDPAVEVQIGGAGVAGALRRIYEVRRALAARDGRDSAQWRTFVEVLGQREEGPAIRLLTARARGRAILAMLDAETFEVLATLGPG